MGRTPSAFRADLDSVPSLPEPPGRLCRFTSSDHLGSTDWSLRENIDTWLADHGIGRPARVLMLASPRRAGPACGNAGRINALARRLKRPVAPAEVPTSGP